MHHEIPVRAIDATIILTVEPGRMSAVLEGSGIQAPVALIDVPSNRFALSVRAVTPAARRVVLIKLAEALERLSYERDADGKLMHHQDNSVKSDEPVFSPIAPMTLALLREIREYLPEVR